MDIEKETVKKLMDLTHRAELAELSLKHLQQIIAEECGKGDPVQALCDLRDRCDAWEKRACELESLCADRL